MIKIKTLVVTAFAIIGFSSCEKEDNTLEQQNETIIQLETGNFDITHNKVENLKAIGEVNQEGNTPPTATGEYTKFNFATGKITTSDNDWDIAFLRTTILINGGEKTGKDNEPERTGNVSAYLVENIFDNVTTVDKNLLKQDSVENGPAIPTGSGNGWYSYDISTHIISPKPGITLVFKTAENKYAKIEILSYYKNSTVNSTDFSTSGYYTFNFSYYQ